MDSDDGEGEKDSRKGVFGVVVDVADEAGVEGEDDGREDRDWGAEGASCKVEQEVDAQGGGKN